MTPIRTTRTFRVMGTDQYLSLAWFPTSSRQVNNNFVIWGVLTFPHASLWLGWRVEGTYQAGNGGVEIVQLVTICICSFDEVVLVVLISPDMQKEIWFQNGSTEINLWEVQLMSPRYAIVPTQMLFALLVKNISYWVLSIEFAYDYLEYYTALTCVIHISCNLQLTGSCLWRRCIWRPSGERSWWMLAGKIS